MASAKKVWSERAPQRKDLNALSKRLYEVNALFVDFLARICSETQNVTSAQRASM